MMDNITDFKEFKKSLTKYTEPLYIDNTEFKIQVSPLYDWVRFLKTRSNNEQSESELIIPTMNVNYIKTQTLVSTD